jgi:NAD(P)-dependent dehydrogenase (short-subunit alcohol dehydrogenase family)
MFLAGKVAVVTAGGGPGIGRAISLALASEGAAVVIAELDSGRAEATATEIRDAGGTALAVPTDVSRKPDVIQMVERAVDAFGTVHVLCNHAGASTGGRIDDMPEEVWDAHLAVHLKGTFLCTQAVIPQMRHQQWGRIVNTVSRVAYRPTSLGLADYAAAKAGIIGFSRAVAMETGADGITINCVAPGHVSGSGLGLAGGYPLPSPEQEQHRIDTEGQILEPHRMVTPQEIAGAVLYLVGPYAGRVTGTVMHVNGGSYLPA